MLPTAIIVLREVLEAALIVGIVMAASRGAPGRGRWVSAGSPAACSARCWSPPGPMRSPLRWPGMGQELFDAAILFAAVGMLGWHNVWMSRHGRDLAAEASRLGTDVRSGARPLWALAIVVGLAVLREGSEIVLFLYGITLAGAGGGPSGDGRRRGPRLGGRGDLRHGDLFRPRQHSAAPSVYGDELAGAAARRRDGLARRGVSDAGRSGAGARHQSVGHLVPARAKRA